MVAALTLTVSHILSLHYMLRLGAQTKLKTIHPLHVEYHPFPFALLAPGPVDDFAIPSPFMNLPHDQTGR